MATVEAAESTSTTTSEDRPESGHIESPSKLYAELTHLATDFKGQCRIAEDAKHKFVKIVKLHPDNLDIVFNFKIKENYPVSTPVIEIRSESLDEDDMFDLLTFMNQNAESLSPVSMETLVNDAIGWLQEGGIDLRGGRSKNNVKTTGEPKKSKKSKKKKKQVDVEDKKKKAPMRTAIDVVERIQWDPQIQQDECIVGYLDRMTGLQEKYFTAFSWEDIASVDYTVLAIPKHRIQYFKYKGEIVWDKRNRLDNVFGSTGSGITIRDVITRMENKASTPGSSGEGVQAARDDGEYHVDSDYYDDDDDDSSDSDSDDGIEVTIRDGVNETHFSGSEEDNEGSDSEDTHNKYWRDKLRPNYFLALRVTDDEIRDNVREIQNYIASNDARLKECAIPEGALHITLCTVGLETPEQVQNAVRCLKEAKEEFENIVPKTKKLKFKGVDHFFNRVVYGKVVECPQEFYEFVDHLKLCLIEKGVDIRDYHEFVPHMTLAKISRPFSRATGKKYIPPWLYSCFGQTVLGEQAVDNIHLCEMGDNRQSDGFYATATSLDI